MSDEFGPAQSAPDYESGPYPGSRGDIHAAVARMGRTLGIKRELQQLEPKLDPGETVLEALKPILRS